MSLLVWRREEGDRDRKEERERNIEEEKIKNKERIFK